MKGKPRRTQSDAAPGLPDPPGSGPFEEVPDVEAARRRQIFIVSVSDTSGDVRGVVEAVRSGWKERFQGLDALGRVVEAMLQRPRRDDALTPDETRRVT